MRHAFRSCAFGVIAVCVFVLGPAEKVVATPTTDWYELYDQWTTSGTNAFFTVGGSGPSAVAQSFTTGNFPVAINRISLNLVNSSTTAAPYMVTIRDSFFGEPDNIVYSVSGGTLLLPAGFSSNVAVDNQWGSNPYINFDTNFVAAANTQYFIHLSAPSTALQIGYNNSSPFTDVVPTPTFSSFSFSEGSYTSVKSSANQGFNIYVVPEPSTIAMALAGLACGGYSMWRRRGNRRRIKSELKSTRNRYQLVCLTLVALSIIAAGAASTTSAAVIVWDTPQTITGDSDVNTSGSLVYAYNVGPSPTVSSTVTVNGVAFQPFPIINFPATNAFTFGSVTISESPGSLFGYDVASTSGSYGLLSPAYRALLDGGGGAGVPDTVTVSLGGLSLGQQYLFQWWASNAANISFVSTVTGLATNSVTLDSNLTNAAGGLGQFVMGTFTADGATQNITFTGAANSPLINAFQIRAIPEPSTIAIALAGLACGGFSMWRRRKRV